MIIHGHSQATLLPKLRVHFAEFLNRGSPDRLAFLMPPTCVGLRYGYLDGSLSLRGFSRQFGLTHLWPCGTAHCSESSRGFSNGSHIPNSLAPTMSNRQAELSDCVTPSLPFRGTGIFTGCPSPTAHALGLGPTNPTRITLASEPLDFRRRRFSRRFRYSSQHSHF